MSSLWASGSASTLFSVRAQFSSRRLLARTVEHDRSPNGELIWAFLHGWASGVLMTRGGRELCPMAGAVERHRSVILRRPAAATSCYRPTIGAPALRGVIGTGASSATLLLIRQWEP